MKTASSSFRSARLLGVLLLVFASSTASAQLLTKTLTQTNKLLDQTTKTVTQTTSTLTQTTGEVVNGLVPLSVTASGNHAQIVVGNDALPLAEVSLDFDDADGLNPSNLGVTAQVLNTVDGLLLSRLPDLGLTNLTGALPLLITIEPPANGGLRFRNTGRMEIHTHLLPYTAGSSLRVFKAPLLGPFRDVTEEIASGSVRARTRYGGFSQFLILVDLRPTGTVISEKIDWLRGKVAALASTEQAAFAALLDQTQTAVDAGNYAGALAAVDAFQTRAQSRAGIHIPNEWRASGEVTNHAGELIAGASTLRFSVTYLRDFGQ